MSVPILPHPGGRPRAWLAWALALGFVAIPVRSGATGIPFEEALRSADARAPALQARQSRLAASREEAARAAALPDPMLTLGVANLMTMKRIGVMQEFPARAKRQARQAVAERTVDRARAASLAERLAVRSATAQAWIDLWAAQRELSAMQASREPVAIAARTAGARTAGGTGTVAEALAVQADALDLENRIDAAQAAVEAGHAGLGEWIGGAPD